GRQPRRPGAAPGTSSHDHPTTLGTTDSDTSLDPFAPIPPDPTPWARSVIKAPAVVPTIEMSDTPNSVIERLLNQTDHPARCSLVKINDVSIRNSQLPPTVVNAAGITLARPKYWS
ncbi:MAG: hypothetical protein ACRDSH_02295, partial [Pseudonocardiaceae bacterium]